MVGLMHCAISREVTYSMVSEYFTSRLHYGPGVVSASNRNENQEYVLGGKGGRCVGLTAFNYLNVQTVLKSGNLNLLELS
jgi:hypothetical protein